MKSLKRNMKTEGSSKSIFFFLTDSNAGPVRLCSPGRGLIQLGAGRRQVEGVRERDPAADGGVQGAL